MSNYQVNFSEKEYRELMQVIAAQYLSQFPHAVGLIDKMAKAVESESSEVEF